MTLQKQNRRGLHTHDRKRSRGDMVILGKVLDEEVVSHLHPVHFIRFERMCRSPALHLGNVSASSAV